MGLKYYHPVTRVGLEDFQVLTCVARNAGIRCFSDDVTR